MPAPDSDNRRFYELPSNAQLAFTGKVWEIWQWEQEMFDGSHATFEACLRKLACVILATQGDRIVILREEQPGKPPFISVPGGCADTWQEDALTVGQRELLEETGLQSQDWHPFEIFKFRGRTRWDIHFYIARDCKKVQEPHLDKGEKVKVELVDFETFLDLASSPAWRNVALSPLMFEAKHDPRKKEEFRQRIFGKYPPC